MQTNYRETWEEICFILSGNVNNSMAENVYEQRVIMALDKLGWSQYKKEIQTQKKLPIGRQSTIRPDIVLYGPNKKALVAIEVKRPAEKLASLEQLKSYMRQMKADFGLLVGHEIRIYYDGALNPNPEPLQLGKVSFDPASTEGQQFVEIFTKANFQQEEYKPFLNKKISQFNLNREVKKLKKNICNQETRVKIIDFLKSEYSEVSQDIVSEALKSLKIDIYYADGPPSSAPHRSRIQPAPLPVQPEPKYLLTCKNKATGECFIYVEDNGHEPQVITPTGRFIPFDEDIFYPPLDEEKIEDLLFSKKINEDQVNKYKEYQKFQRKSKKKKIVKNPGSKAPKTDLLKLVGKGWLREGQTLFFSYKSQNLSKRYEAKISGNKLDYQGELYAMSKLVKIILEDEGFVSPSGSYRGPEFWITSDRVSIKELWQRYIEQETVDA